MGTSIHGTLEFVAKCGVLVSSCYQQKASCTIQHYLSDTFLPRWWSDKTCIDAHKHTVWWSHNLAISHQHHTVSSSSGYTGMINLHRAIRSLHVVGDTATVIQPLKCHIKKFGARTIIATLKAWISVSREPLWSYRGSCMPLYQPAGQAWTLLIIYCHMFIKRVQWSWSTTFTVSETVKMTRMSRSQLIALLPWTAVKNASPVVHSIWNTTLPSTSIKCGMPAD